MTYEALLSRGECSVARALEVVGERWTFLVLREAFRGVRRFDEMQRELGIARNVLADRLARLVDEGVLERRQYQDRPPRHEYRLTDKGRDLHMALVGLLQWGDRWLVDEPPLRLQHKGCGDVTRLQLVCASCGEPVAARDVRGVPSGSTAAGGAGLP